MQNIEFEQRKKKDIKEKYAVVNERGNLKLPPDMLKRYGLKPGTKVYFEEGADTILLHRPISHLARVYIEPTNHCNLNCRTCIRNAWDVARGYMDFDVFERIMEGLKDCSPMPTVFFGGFGEPLVHPEIIPMIRMCKELGSQVELITNGVLLTQECARQLLEVGLDRLWVSLDGATPESYADIRLENVFQTITENMKYLNLLKLDHSSEKPQIGIVFVAMKRNVRELPAVIELGAQMGARTFLISNVLPYTSEMRDEVLYNQSTWNWKSYLTQIAMPRMDAEKETIDILKELLRGYEWTDFGSPEFSKPFDTCPFVEKGSMSIRWDGMVSPCLPLLYSYNSYLDDKMRYTHECTIGSLKEEKLLEIWENPDYVAQRKRIREFDFSPCTKCNGCEMAENNQEDCFVNRAPVCGGCLWAQGFIQCP